MAARHRYFHELSRGASVYFLEESDALEKKVEKVNRHGIANIYCVPMYLELLSDQARRMSARGDSSMLFPHAPLLEATSSPVSPGLRKRVEESISPCLVNCYALSEVGHISSTLDLKEFDPDGSDVGRPLDGIDVGIFDEAGLPVRPGDVGQIAVRFTAYEGAVLYLDESGAWVSPMRGEWFFTGDLGRMAPGGKLIFMGRADDLIIFNGINVFPNEIERSIRPSGA